MTKEEFCKDMTNDNNHRLLLWKALEASKGDVVEFGSGWGSTSYLREYCKQNKRKFYSYDNGEEWAKKHGSTFTSNWDDVNHTGAVILIDHAPGERRHIDIAHLKDKFDYIVIHDSEPVGAGDYQYENIWHLFKNRVDVKTIGAWASCVSNLPLDWQGETYKEYIIS